MTDVHVPPDEATEVEPCSCDWASVYAHTTTCSDDPHPDYPDLCMAHGRDARTCDWCARAVHRHDTYYCNHPAAHICESCYYDFVVNCDHCDEYYSTDDYSGCPNDCGTADRLLNYGYKPYPAFHDVDGLVPPVPGVVYMGVELEMESNDHVVNDCVDLIDRHLGSFVYCKEDGSLSHGLEMVTHPFTLEYAHKPNLWSVLDELRRMGCRSWNTTTCGMHIHVSRTAFDGSAHLFRFTQLVLKNEPACTSFAGRKNDTYASFRDGYQPGLLAKVIKGREYGSRGAVNLQNGATVEVRMFRGSLRINRLLANLEFVHAAVEYTRELTVPQVATGGLSWRAFATWITDHRNTYSHLFEYLSLDPGTPNTSTHVDITSF